MIGQKHLVKCRCILQQYKTAKNPPNHCFIVFSEIGDDGRVKPKYAQCNNCGVVHKVIDICKSEALTGKEDLKSIVTIDDIKPTLHQNFATILEKNNADLATWEAVQFAVNNKRWGDFVVLTSEVEGDTRMGKYLVVLGESLMKVETYTREESFDGS